MTLSRRESVKWMMAAVAVAGGGWANTAEAQVSLPAAPVLPPVAPWPTLILPPVTALGYGTDPDTMAPSAPWPLTLAAGHRALLNTLGDLILPADEVSKGAGQCDIAAFFDEWVSAPYPDQVIDRPKLISLLLWLDAQSRLMSGHDFTHTDESLQSSLVDAVLSGAAPPEAVDAFVRFRGLMIFGYYSLPENLAAAGMEPETAIVGDYPGPSDAAMQHLNALLVSLELPTYKLNV